MHASIEKASCHEEHQGLVANSICKSCPRNDTSASNIAYLTSGPDIDSDSESVDNTRLFMSSNGKHFDRKLRKMERVMAEQSRIAEEEKAELWKELREWKGVARVNASALADMVRREEQMETQLRAMAEEAARERLTVAAMSEQLAERDATLARLMEELGRERVRSSVTGGAEGEVVLVAEHMTMTAPLEEEEEGNVAVALDEDNTPTPQGREAAGEERASVRAKRGRGRGGEGPVR